MIHPDRLKGIEIAERTEPPKDRDTHTINLQPPSSMIPPLRQEQKHPQHQQAHQHHHRSPIGLVSTSASATGGDNLSHDTSPGSDNNSIAGRDSSLSWNPSRPPAHASISPLMAHKPLLPQPQTSIRSSALDKPQHSLSSILNPDGVGSSGGGYIFGSSPAIISAVNTNNNVNLSTSNITTTSIAVAAGMGHVTTTTTTAAATTTSTSGSASTNSFSMGPQRASPQAAPPTNVLSMPTMSTAIMVNPAVSASSSPQMPVKQVPTGPRADRANQHIPHGHLQSRVRGYRGGRGNGFRGRGGEGSGMVVKREFENDDSPVGMGSGYRGGRGCSSEWAGARARGGFDGVGRGVAGRRDARFGSVDRMEGPPGSLGGVAGVVSSAVVKGAVGGSLMRRNSFGEFETVESGADRAFDGRDRAKEMEHEKERIENVARKERYQSSGAFGEGKTEIKVERVEGQPQPVLPFSVSSVIPTDSNQSLAPHRPEAVKPAAPPQQQQQTTTVVAQPPREEPPQFQIVTTIQTEDRMDIDDSDEVLLTQEDVVSKIGEIDQELGKWKDLLAELGRKRSEERR